MYDYYEELNRTARADSKRYNSKAITTARQWVNDDFGSAGPHTASWGKVFEAYRDHRASQQWN